MTTAHPAPMDGGGLLRGWRRAGHSQGRLDDCSLVIPTYQRPAEVRVLLDSLVRLPDPPGEVVVVDGSTGTETTDAVGKWANENAFGFDLAYVDSPSGLTRQRNVGIDASDGEFVFFLDDDCIPEPGYFSAIRTAMRSDSSIGGARGTFLDGGISRRAVLKQKLRLVPDVAPCGFAPTATSRSPSGVAPFTGWRTVEVLPGAVAYRRAALEQHRFSYFFDGYCQGEDLEMSVRVGKHWRLVWCGDARLEHRHAPGGRPKPFTMGRMEVRNRHFIWKRHVRRVKLVDRMRFWLDAVGFGVAYDLVKQVRHPGDFGHTKHALGLVAGAAQALFRPARHEEPEARREYVFAFGPP